MKGSEMNAEANAGRTRLSDGAELGATVTQHPRVYNIDWFRAQRAGETSANGGTSHEEVKRRPGHHRRVASPGVKTLFDRTIDSRARASFGPR
ncbi:MAG: hypothetical protein ACRDXC_08635 [Acidimicrobiales bacterium]